MSIARPATAAPAAPQPSSLTASWRTTLAVALLAGTGLGLQIALTRVFSLVFPYQAVFVVVTVAVMGLGIGAALAQVSGTRMPLGPLALILAGVIALLAWLLLMFSSANHAVVAALFTVPPYLMIGFVTSSLYARFPQRAGALYGADLLGAAFGLGAGLLLVSWSGPFTTLLALSGLTALAALALGVPRTHALGLCVFLGLAPLNTATNLVRYDPVGVVDAPPDKTLVHVLRDPNLQARPLKTRFGAFAQVDAVSVQGDARRFVFSDAGAGSVMLPAGFDDATLERETAYLPFTTGQSTRTLIVGAGAGLDVRMARRAGARAITALEINPGVVQLTRDQAGYNGGVLDLPGVQTVIGDGRHFAQRSRDTFDLVYLNLVYSQAAAPSSATLAENYAFTTEAFRAYWRRLRPDGRIGIVAHNGVEGVKLLLSALAALEQEGIALHKAVEHAALVMTNPGDDPENAPSVLILHRKPWTRAQADTFSASVIRRELKALYIPFDYSFTLGVLQSGKMNLEQYVRANPQYDLRPTTDDRPFFYKLEPGLPQSLVAVGVLCAVLVGGFFVFVQKTASRPEHRSSLRWLAYFAGTGAAFMMAEVALLKRFELLLGQPVLTLAVVVGGLLLGGGLGSLMAQRVRLEHGRWLVRGAGLIVAGTLVALAVGSPWLVALVLPLELPMRAVCLLAILIVFGVPVGLMFPSAVRRVAGSRLVPAFWGVNALASSLGSVAVTLLALPLGLGAVLLLAALCYLVVGLLMP